MRMRSEQSEQSAGRYVTLRHEPCDATWPAAAAADQRCADCEPVYRGIKSAPTWRSGNEAW